MRISEVLAALTAIYAEHGDIHVLHHDDWNDFLVETVRVEPAQDGTDPIHDMAHPTHVVIEGERQFFEPDGTFTRVYLSKAAE